MLRSVYAQKIVSLRFLEDIILNRVSTLLFYLSASSIAISLLETHHWFFSLLANLQEWFLLCAFVAILLILKTTINKALYLFVLIMVFCIHVSKVLPLNYIELRTPSNKSDVETTTVFYANLNSQNNSKHKLLDSLKQINPEVVLLLETNRSWANELKKIEHLYPYNKAIFRENNFGLTVLSKHDFTIQNILFDKEEYIPSFILNISQEEQTYSVVLLHAFPPIGEYGTRLRDQYLNTLSMHIREIKSPVLVCGDFNATPWLSVFKNFIAKSQLELATKYFYPNTWPSSILLPGIPIDHCLARGLQVSDYKKGPDVGSDHWPLLLKVR